MEYEQKGQRRTKPIDLLDLSKQYAFIGAAASIAGSDELSDVRFVFSTDVEVLIKVIIRQEPLISEKRKPQLRSLIASQFPYP